MTDKTRQLTEDEALLAGAADMREAIRDWLNRYRTRLSTTTDYHNKPKLDLLDLMDELIEDFDDEVG